MVKTLNSRSIIHQILFVLLLIIVFLFPYSDLLPSVFGIAPTTILILIMGLLWQYFIFRQLKTLKLHRFHIFSLTFIGWTIISVAWSLSTSLTFSTVPKWIRISFLIVAIPTIIDTKKSAQLILVSYILSTQIVATSVIANYVLGNPWSPGRYSAFGLNPNYTGMIVVVSIPLILSFYSRDWNKLELTNPILGLIPLIIGITSVILTGSRGAIVAMLPSIFLILYYVHQKSTNFHKNLKLGVTIITIVATIYILPEMIWSRIASIYTEVVQLSFGNRFEIWVAGLELFTQQPLTGIGFNAFPVAVEPYLGYAVPPESSILGVLYEQGVIGFILFLIIGVSIRNIIYHSLAWFILIISIILLMSVNDWIHLTVLWVLLSVIVVDAFFLTSTTRDA